MRLNDEQMCEEYIRGSFQGIRKNTPLYRDFEMTYMQGLRNGRADALHGPMVEGLHARIKELEDKLRIYQDCSCQLSKG